MRNPILLALSGAVLAITGYICGARHIMIAHAQSTYTRAVTQGTVPKSYGHIAAIIPDKIGTGLIFEDPAGTVRFVSMTGMKEGELPRYDQTPTHGGIPKSYGHLVGAVVNGDNTGLIFEDSAGVIRFLTITGQVEGELTRN